MAEVLFLRETARVGANGFGATSAGFIGPGRNAPPDAIAAAGRLGVDLRNHRSKLVTSDLVRGSTLVVVMSADQAHAVGATFGNASPPVLVLGDLDPLPIDARTIYDPWNASADIFDSSYARIERCVSALVRLVTPAA